MKMSWTIKSCQRLYKMSPLPKLNFEYGGIGGNVPCRHPRELVFCRATFVINLIHCQLGRGGLTMVTCSVVPVSRLQFICVLWNLTNLQFLFDYIIYLYRTKREDCKVRRSLDFFSWNRLKISTFSEISLPSCEPFKLMVYLMYC